MHACPPDAADSGDGICSICPPGMFTYCDAHAVCEQEGLKRGSRYFMVGRHSMQIFAIWLFYTVAHSGVHSLLNTRNSSSTGWQTNDLGYQFYSLGELDVPWGQNEPSSHYEQIAAFTLTGVRDEAQDAQLRTVVCELSTVPVPDVSVPSQFRMNWPMVLESNFMTGQLAVGCFQKLTLPSMLTCALK
ncbi:hypothetical protein PHET_02380 [Paragonimus heterotremus]|uniref:Uncharacterized protein n=1 Tax=Paragonimus heterotremus TaxID=100268 RepID=A0A8J4WJW6_9TREM|nr:hypothetical protein PHET_02380 [Paragonimus heterotremus]